MSASVNKVMAVVAVVLAVLALVLGSFPLLGVAVLVLGALHIV